MKKEFVVYTATNKINGKIYVGKTYNFEKRKNEHIYDIDDDLPFHRALKKYGVENFEWKIIDYAYSSEEIKEKEIYWIKKLNTCIHSQSSNGYNITLGGEGGVSWNSLPVIQYDLDGNYIQEFLSCAHASVCTGIGRHNIGDCANGITHSSGGYQWRYKIDDEILPINPYKKKSSKRKNIIQLDLDGNFINEFKSITEASETLGIGRSNISACLTGKTKRCRGYQWIYSEKYDKSRNYKFEGISIKDGIIQLDENKKAVNHFRNCSEAARFLGEETKVHKQIHKAICTGNKCKGFYWCKYEDYINVQHGNTEVIA